VPPASTECRAVRAGRGLVTTVGLAMSSLDGGKAIAGAAVAASSTSGARATTSRYSVRGCGWEVIGFPSSP
jgi:hypothetical protein